MTLPSTLISSATLGTAQSDFVRPTVDGPLDDLLAQLDSASPEAQLLITAAALKLHEQAGWIPPQAKRVLPEPGPVDATTVCGRQALRHLMVMLKGHYREALFEWLRELADQNQRIPEEALPLILDAGHKNDDQRPLTLPVIGERGRWLGQAVTSRSWNWCNPAQDEKVWMQGSKDERKALLKHIRQEQPARARQLLADAWDSEKAPERAVFLQTFSTRLSMNDEPFLEAALDDRAASVRMVAIPLLAELPDSRFCTRMRERATPLLELGQTRVRGKLKLVANPCSTYDENMERDGIPESTGSSELPEGIWWTQHILRWVAPSFLCYQWEISLSELIEAAQNSDAPFPLMDVLAEAALQTGDAESLWGLLAADITVFNPLNAMHVLTHTQFELLAIDLLETHREGFRDGHPAEKVLWAIDRRWSRELSMAFVLSLKRYLKRDRVRPSSSLRATLLHFARMIALEAKDSFLHTLDVQTSAEKVWGEMLDEIRLLLNFREEMIEAIRNNQ